MTIRPKETRPCNGGVQQIYSFSNGYGASVVKHSFSYGHENDLWELAVLKNDRICYDTPITSDVIGRLSDADVQTTLAEIANLPQQAEAA